MIQRNERGAQCREMSNEWKGIPNNTAIEFS